MGPTPLDTAALEAAIDALARGEPDALDQVFQLAYDELRTLARARLRSVDQGHTLNTTALVHEAFLRVRNGHTAPRWESTRHFFAFASKAMRHILVDHARRREAKSRGGGARNFVTLNTWMAPDGGDDPIDLLALDDALRLLGERDPRLEQVVECRFFSGLTASETAEVLDLSTRTVERDWLRARTYLHHLMAS